MPDRWVVNASPVILLGKAGVIHLLPSLCDELVVPTQPPVFEVIVAPGAGALISNSNAASTSWGIKQFVSLHA